MLTYVDVRATPQVIAVHDEYLLELRKTLLLSDSRGTGTHLAMRELDNLLASALSYASKYRKHAQLVQRGIRRFAAVYPRVVADGDGVSLQLAGLSGGGAGAGRRHGSTFGGGESTGGPSSVGMGSASTGAGSTSALVLCTTAEDRIHESFADCVTHSSGFCKLLSACLAVLQANVAAGARHLADVLPILNFNEFYLRADDGAA